MPVFSKGLRCTRGGGGSSSGGGGGGGSSSDKRRHGVCPAGSDDDDDDTDNLANTSAASGPSSQHNAEVNTRQPGQGIEEAKADDDGDFRFLLTISDRQAALPEVETVTPLTSPSAATTEDVTAAALEFEHADQEIELPPPPPQPAAPRKKRAAAKSSCGRATSEEEDPSTEDEAPPPPPEPTVEQVPVQLLPRPESEEEFLVLLTGLLAHQPPPGEDFRFFLTINQAEVATS